MKEINKFKEYVHSRLDKMGIPKDPEPAKNAEHGCRIEGRLNYIEKRLNRDKRHIEEAKILMLKRFPPEEFGEDSEIQVIWEALEALGKLQSDTQQIKI